MSGAKVTPRQRVLRRWPDATCARDEDGYRVWHDFAIPGSPRALGRVSTLAFHTEREAWRSAAEAVGEGK